MKATEQYFPVVLFIMLYKVVLSFESVATQKKKKMMSGSFLKCCLHYTVVPIESENEISSGTVNYGVLLSNSFL